MLLFYDSVLYILLGIYYIILVFIAMSERIKAGGETSTSIETLSLASVCVCLKLLYYFRPYR